MKQMDLGELTDMCIPYLVADGRVEKIHLLKNRMVKTIS